MNRKKVLFICTHNSARSQMAEGLMNHLKKDKYIAFSAGVIATKVKENAIKAMEEIGIDIKNHFSKTIEVFAGEDFDYVITVCDSAKESCPFFPRAKNIIHKSFKDPSTLDDFRKVRDQIKKWIEEYF